LHGARPFKLPKPSRFEVCTEAEVMGWISLTKTDWRRSLLQWMPQQFFAANLEAAKQWKHQPTKNNGWRVGLLKLVCRDRIVQVRDLLSVIAAV